MNRRARPGKQTALSSGKPATKPWFLLPDRPWLGLLTSADWAALGKTFGLTDRELKVAILIFEDRTRENIGRRLKRSRGGIRKRIDKVFMKLNIKSKLALIQRLWHVHRARQPQEHKDALESASASPNL